MKVGIDYASGCWIREQVLNVKVGVELNIKEGVDYESVCWIWKWALNMKVGDNLRNKCLKNLFRAVRFELIHKVGGEWLSGY